MPAINNKKNPNTTSKKNTSPISVADIVARRSQQAKKKAPMLTTEIVPAGTYRSVVLAVEDAHSEEGKAMADVTYRFTDAVGEATEARIRYPVTGYHIQRLVDALIDAGLPEGAPLTDAVGLEEEVTIVYPYEGALGKIKRRQPATQAAISAPKKPVPKQVLPKKRKLLIDDEEETEEIENVDEEFDDFLEEDED